MTADPLIKSTTTARNYIAGLKKKLTKIQTEVLIFSEELDRADAKLDSIIDASDRYKSWLERDVKRKVRELEIEIEKLRANQKPEIDADQYKVAVTVGIFETMLRYMADGSEDFILISQAFLYPAVYERLTDRVDAAYLFDEAFEDLIDIVYEGKEFLASLRQQFDSHLTYPSTWDEAIEITSEWWKERGLVFLYTEKDSRWEADLPLSLNEMIAWRDLPAERPIALPKVFDAYETYRRHKDDVYEQSGLSKIEAMLIEQGKND